MQMKRTIAVLLAVCFLMSVTVAAVSAGAPDNWNGPRGNSTVDNNKGDNNKGDNNKGDSGNQVKPTDNNKGDSGNQVKPTDNNKGDKQNGRDKNGYDKNGRDKNGYDRNGRDKNGYDKNGRDKNGYDRNGRDKNGYDKKDDKKIEKKVVRILKVVKTKNGIKKLDLIKNTLKSHGRVIKVWFTQEWVVVKFNEHNNGRDNIQIRK
jgi:hypothetical protein